jgi:hypothetical protein
VRRMRAALMIGAALVVLCPHDARAQWSYGAQAIPVFSRADPAPIDSAVSQFLLAQPVVWVHGMLWEDRVHLHAMLDGEALTMRNGQIATGDFGEGYSDKRHPHTWAHELIASLVDAPRLPGPVHWSLSAGKGFAPFGSDDPMNRPAVLYPVNHHWSQILERAVAIVGVRAGPAMLEVGWFNGDEPENPWQWPNWSRFADSRSARVTVEPLQGLEVQGSLAHVASPEHRLGAGLDHTMWNVSARYARRVGGGALYSMAELAHTDEEGVFSYHSALVEGQYTTGRHRPYLRLEQTDRPEEPRLLNDPFRSVRPHSENSNLGITRWKSAVAGYGWSVTRPGARLRAEAALEAAYLRVSVVTGAFLNPAAFYGRNDLWLLSVGLRIGAFDPLHRMGRYGVAEGDAAHSDHH